MKLIINSRGARLGKTGERFKVKIDKVTEEIPAKKVEQIIMTTSASVTTDALALAIDYNIDVIFLKQNGRPFGRVWHSKMGSISTIRKNQLELSENHLGQKFINEWINKKMDNQIEHLVKLSKNRRDLKKKELINKNIDIIKKEKNQVNKILKIKDVDKARSSIQGYEGVASRAYFSVLSEIIPDKYAFEGRSKNPAEDYFNCMLNYGYGILYSNVEKSCIIAGLDPYIGIMHTDNYNRKALTFDLVECYRGYIDQIIFKLFTTNKIIDDCFKSIEGGYYLDIKGKQILLEAYNEHMEKHIKYNGREIELQNIIQYDCHAIANSK